MPNLIIAELFELSNTFSYLIRILVVCLDIAARHVTFTKLPMVKMFRVCQNDVKQCTTNLKERQKIPVGHSRS